MKETCISILLPFQNTGNTVIEVTSVFDPSYSRTSLYWISYVQYFICMSLNRLFHIGYISPTTNVTRNVRNAHALHNLQPGAVTDYTFHGYQDNTSSQNIPLWLSNKRPREVTSHRWSVTHCPKLCSWKFHYTDLHVRQIGETSIGLRPQIT